MKSTALAAAAALTLALTGAAVADVEKTETYEFEVEKGARISLENVNGDISIRGGSRDRVQVVARKKAGSQDYLDGLKIEIEADARLVRIETRHPRSEGGWFNWGEDKSGRVSFELEVPADVNLDVISTVNGEISISGVSGAVEVETVNGSLELEGLRGNARLETVNGSVEARFDRVGEGQRIDAETVNGRIELHLPEDTSARVTAETLNGGIDAEDFGLETEKGFVGRDCNGEIGSGSAHISLDTVNGAIRLRKY